MRIYVLSRANVERMHTVRMLRQEGIRFILVVDTEAQARTACKEFGRMQVVVSNAKDVVQARNFINDIAGGWYISMDDNIQYFTMVEKNVRGCAVVDTTDGTNWRPLFNQHCTAAQFIEEFEQMLPTMKRDNIPYGGVASTENPWFRGSHYSYRRFVKSKVCIINSKADLKWKHTMCHDSHLTALCIARYGRVLVNNFMFYKAAWYEKGGLGSREAREKAGLLVQLEACVKEFPGLVAMAKGKNSALRVLRTSDAAVANWQREHNYV